MKLKNRLYWTTIGILLLCIALLIYYNPKHWFQFNFNDVGIIMYLSGDEDYDYITIENKSQSTLRLKQVFVGNGEQTQAIMTFAPNQKIYFGTINRNQNGWYILNTEGVEIYYIKPLSNWFKPKIGQFKGTYDLSIK